MKRTWKVKINWFMLKIIGIMVGFAILYATAVSALGMFLWWLLDGAVPPDWCVNIVGGVVCLAVIASVVIKIHRKDRDGD